MNWVLSVIAGAVQRFLLAALYWGSNRRMVDGVGMANASDLPTEKVFRQVTKGCTLIAEVDPRRWKRLRRDVRRILVLQAGGQAYAAAARTILIDGPWLRKADPRRVALLLVHEATHARIDAAGISYLVELRERIEHRCVDTEIAFAQRLPNSGPLIDELLDKRGRVWWTPEQLRERDRLALEVLRASSRRAGGRTR